MLASPFVGLSNDALALVRRSASKRPLFSGIEHSLPPALDERDTRLLRAFRQRFDRLAEAMTRLSLERLCERIVSEHDYDLAVLAQWDGRRRYANMRKLARLARSYEELRGPDVEGFVRFVNEREAVGARELEAVAEEEGGDAVRLLTIHAAKGLEFKVVIVADAGRDKAPPSPDEILALSDGRFGFRVADPVTTKRRGAFDYDDVRDARRARGGGREAAPLLRRDDAREGAADRLRLDRPREEGGCVDADRLGARAARRGRRSSLPPATSPVEIERNAARLVVRIDRHRPEARAGAAVAKRARRRGAARALRGARGGRAVRRRAGAAAARRTGEPPLHRPRRLSFTALSTFEQCSYRYYARYVVGMPERKPVGTGDGGLRATEIGDAVHKLLEQVDLAAPAPPDLEQVRVWYPTVSDEELERIRAFVAAYCDSELARRVAALDGVQKERHFTFEHDGVLLHGFVDAMHLDGSRALVVDYKTNLIGDVVAGGDRRGRLQPAASRLRARVLPRRCGGRRGRLPLPRALGRRRLDDVHARRRCRRSRRSSPPGIARIHAGEFRPTPSDFACSGCPALDLVCAGHGVRSLTGGRTPRS